MENEIIKALEYYQDIKIAIKTEARDKIMTYKGLVSMIDDSHFFASPPFHT